MVGILKRSRWKLYASKSYLGSFHHRLFDILTQRLPVLQQMNIGAKYRISASLISKHRYRPWISRIGRPPNRDPSDDEIKWWIYKLLCFYYTFVSSTLFTVIHQLKMTTLRPQSSSTTFTIISLWRSQPWAALARRWASGRSYLCVPSCHPQHTAHKPRFSRLHVPHSLNASNCGLVRRAFRVEGQRSGDASIRSGQLAQ